jgi:HEAT repeat protein
MGAEAVPYLLSEAQPSRFDRFIEDHPRIGKWIGNRYAISGDRSGIAYTLMDQLIASGIYPVEEASRLLESDLVEYRQRMWFGFALLARMGKNASNCIPKLIELMNSTDPRVKEAALFIYGRVAPQRDPHLADIRAAVRRKKITAREGVTILTLLEAPTRGLIPALGKELCAAQGEERRKAFLAFKETKDPPELMTPFLIRAYDTSEPRLRAEFLDVFAHCGPGSAEAVPLITTALDDEWYYVRAAAARALGKIRVTSPEILVALLKMRGDPNAEVAEAARDACQALLPPNMPMPEGKGAW